MKKILLVVVIIIFITLLLPLAIVWLIGGSGEGQSPIESGTVSVYVSEEDCVKDMDINEYLKCVVAAEMPADFEEDDYYCGLSVGLLLFILAIGVNLLVRVGMVKSSYDTLLQEGEYTKEEKLFKKKTDTFSGVYWCLTTAIYLAWSFWTMSWDITWIVWPVAGVLFAALLGVVKMVLKNGSETQHYI